MKRTALKRKTPMSRGTKPMARGGKLRANGRTPEARAKQRIQATLRRIVTDRDGGCVLRHYVEAGDCGGYTKDGTLILQAEHLVTRSRTRYFADLRNVVCLCQRHHIYFKKQNPSRYWTLIKKHLGDEHWQWVEKASLDPTPWRFDWRKAEADLQAEEGKLN